MHPFHRGSPGGGRQGPARRCWMLSCSQVLNPLNEWTFCLKMTEKLWLQEDMSLRGKKGSCPKLVWVQ